MLFSNLRITSYNVCYTKLLRDNVHYQNTLEYADRLIQAGKQFDMFTYPNRNHNLRGGNVRHHLYQMKSDYIFKNL